MSHEATTWAYEQIVRHRLKTGPQATLMRLCNHANAKGICWPSVVHIAAMTNQDEKTVRRHLGAFVEIGILEKQPRGGKGQGRQTTVYQLVGLTDILSGRANGHFVEANGHQVSVSTPNIQTSNRTTKECAFALFWATYPVKRNKAKAEEIWKRKRLDSMADRIIADVKARVTQDGLWVDGFIPHPTTYLNGRRWEDEMTQPKKANQRKKIPTDDAGLMAMAEEYGISTMGKSTYQLRGELMERVQ